MISFRLMEFSFLLVCNSLFVLLRQTTGNKLSPGPLTEKGGHGMRKKERERALGFQDESVLPQIK